MELLCILRVHSIKCHHGFGRVLGVVGGWERSLGDGTLGCGGHRGQVAVTGQQERLRDMAVT